MPWINHLPPVCWSTFGILVWNDSGYVNLTQWWYFFIIFEYILHISTPHIMIFCFPLPYLPLSTSALFLLSTLVLTLYIDVVLSLSMSNIIHWSSTVFIFSLVLNLAYIDYSLCQIWRLYIQYLRCCDHSNKCLFLVIQQTEVLLNFFWWVYTERHKLNQHWDQGYW